VLVIAYGVFTTIDGQREYNKQSDKISDIVKRRETFTEQFPTAEVDGEIKPDLTNATQTDLMFVAMLRRDENDAQRQQVDADNQRRTGVRVIGLGVIGLALAYLVLPDRKSRSSSEEVAAAANTSDTAGTK